MYKTIALTFSTFALAWVFTGCLADTDDTTDEHGQATDAIHDDAAVVAACAQHPNKEAVCHIPPGNPANAHTICISENAVQKHLDLHGDFLGACNPGNGDGGGDSGSGGSSSSGAGGSSSSGAGGSSSGSGGSSSSGSGGGVPNGGDCSEEYPPCTSDAECAVTASCNNGCCVPFTN